MATPLERQTIPSAELIVAATMLTRHSPATNMPAAAGPGQREAGSDLLRVGVGVGVRVRVRVRVR
eukprot:scaffold128935_cov39-Phaeocystis_antarctica.AAC.2